jgi:hypothetical protein
LQKPAVLSIIKNAQMGEICKEPIVDNVKNGKMAGIDKDFAPPLYNIWNLQQSLNLLTM